MALAVGVERKAGVLHRHIQANRGQHILQSAPAAHVHVHIARGDERDMAGGGKRLRPPQGLFVMGAEQALPGDPAGIGKALRQPGRVI